MKRILVFTPSASRGGSEMALLNLIRNADLQSFKFHVIAGYEGSLINEFREVAEVSVLPSRKDRKWEIAQKFLRNAFHYDLDLKFIENISEKFKADLWYINTSVLPNISTLATELNIPYVVHFHELLSVYDQMKGKTFRKMIENSVLNICCSDKIKSYLDEFKQSKNTVFNKQVSFERMHSNEDEKERIKEDLSLNNYKFIWLMSGASSPRKGFDLFMQIARSKPDSAFIWIGKQRDHAYNEVVNQIIDNQNITNIRLIDEKEVDYPHFLNCADGFLLTSREDPFPTVMIEAAYLGKPIVAYNSGGVADFVSEKMGFVVDCFDEKEMIEKMNIIESDESSFDNEVLKSTALKYNVLDGVKEWENILNKAKS